MAPVSVYPLLSKWPPGYSTRSRQHPSGLHHFRSVYQEGAPSLLKTGKRPMVPGPGLYGGCSKFQWNCSRSKACVCREIFGRTLSYNRTIPREILPNISPMQKTNNTLHLTFGGILNRHSHFHAISALTT